MIAPLVFSKHLFDGAYALRGLLAVCAFCALSGAIYAFNDIRDVKEDRKHPTKRFRPIASGAISVRHAAAVALVLSTVSIALAAWFNWQFAVVCVSYAVVNIAYSLYFKRFAFVDVGFITGGFLLRVIAGGAAISVPVSGWLLACTALLAALLGFGKRFHELTQTTRDTTKSGETRIALVGYHPAVLRLVLVALATATCIAYVLYTQDERTVAAFGTHRLIWTAPFCAVGILRFLQLAVWTPKRDSPTDQILRDWRFLANIGAWGAAVLAIVYGSG